MCNKDLLFTAAINQVHRHLQMYRKVHWSCSFASASWRQSGQVYVFGLVLRKMEGNVNVCVSLYTELSRPESYVLVNAKCCS